MIIFSLSKASYDGQHARWLFRDIDKHPEIPVFLCHIFDRFKIYFIDTNILYIFLLHIETKYFFFADTNFQSVENQRIHEVERKRAYSLDPNDYLCIQREE